MYLIDHRLPVHQVLCSCSALNIRYQAKKKEEGAKGGTEFQTEILPSPCLDSPIVLCTWQSIKKRTYVYSPMHEKQ